MITEVVIEFLSWTPSSVYSFTMINTQTLVIDRVNKMGEGEKQLDGIEFMSDSVLLFKDLYLNSYDYDNDSMASNDSFKLDKEYEEEFEKEHKFRKEGLNSDNV